MPSRRTWRGSSRILWGREMPARKVVRATRGTRKATPKKATGEKRDMEAKELKLEAGRYDTGFYRVRVIQQTHRREQFGEGGSQYWIDEATGIRLESVAEPEWKEGDAK